MTFFYQYLDWLPPIPENLIQSVDQWSNGQDPAYGGTPTRQTKKDGKLLTNLWFSRYDVSKELESWIQKNIAQDYIYCNYGITQGGDLHHIHSDAHRDWVLSYLLDTGGDNVVTTFYQEEGYPILRERRCAPESYDNMSTLASVKFEPKRWHIINSLILHDVQGLESPRTRIDIALNRGLVFRSFPLE